MDIFLFFLVIFIASIAMYAFVSAFKASDGTARFGWCLLASVLGGFTALPIPYFIFG